MHVLKLFLKITDFKKDTWIVLPPVSNQTLINCGIDLIFF